MRHFHGESLTAGPLPVSVSVVRHPSFVFRRFHVTALVLLVTVNALSAEAHAAQPAESAAISSGRATYRQFCAPCHGSDGKGRGAVASILLVAPSDLTQIRRRRKGAFPQSDFEHILLAPTRAEAPPAMSTQMMLWGPIFRSMESDPALAEARVADLLAFLESIQKK